MLYIPSVVDGDRRCGDGDGVDGDDGDGYGAGAEQIHMSHTSSSVNILLQIRDTSKPSTKCAMG